MHSQHERMLGQSKRNVPNRPELIARHGWDVKYGSHALRLAYQGFEIASPLPPAADVATISAWAVSAPAPALGLVTGAAASA